MTVFAGVLLILAAVAFVALPFFGVTTVVEAADGGDQHRRVLEAQKVEAYAAIKDAELDLRMGKLSDADFVMLREKYAGQALAALAALDVPSSTERAQPSAAGRRAAFCPQCGTRAASGARYCGTCGRQLPARAG